MENVVRDIESLAGGGRNPCHSRTAVMREAEARPLRRGDRAAEEMAAAVSRAAEAFEGRWSRLALRRVNSDLDDRLNRQIALWYEARRAGDPDHVLNRGQGMLRGYAKCAEAMEEADAPDDAYSFGQARDGRVVSFGPVAAAQRVAERFPGQSIPHFTFDEAAELLLELSLVSAVKAAWPGAEVVEVREREAV